MEYSRSTVVAHACHVSRMLHTVLHLAYGVMQEQSWIALSARHSCLATSSGCGLPWKARLKRLHLLPMRPCSSSNKNGRAAKATPQQLLPTAQRVSRMESVGYFAHRGVMLPLVSASIPQHRSFSAIWIVPAGAALWHLTHLSASQAAMRSPPACLQSLHRTSRAMALVRTLQMSQPAAKQRNSQLPRIARLEALRPEQGLWTLTSSILVHPRHASMYTWRGRKQRRKGQPAGICWNMGSPRLALGYKGGCSCRIRTF